MSGQQDNSRKINAADPLLSEYYRRHDELWSAFHRKNEEFRTVYQEYPMDFDYNTNIPELMEVQKEFCRNALALMKEYSSLFP